MTTQTFEIDRRRLLALVAAAGLGGALGLAAPSPAHALSEDAAREHVREAIDEVLALVKAPGTGTEKAGRFRRILEDHAAMPEIARFAAGIAWRDMSASQQDAFVDAFSQFVAETYARRFQEYSSETVTITGVQDGGRRGLIVRSEVSQPGGQPVVVDWLVNDRPGRLVIADLIIEGVSLVVTQREEIGAMLEKRNGDVDQLISDLRSA